MHSSACAKLNTTYCVQFDEHVQDFSPPKSHRETATASGNACRNKLDITSAKSSSFSDARPHPRGTALGVLERDRCSAEWLCAAVCTQAGRARALDDRLACDYLLRT